jgi:hypothetical protein
MQVIEKNGERGRNRTFNLLIKSQLLCQLSYAPGYGLSFSPWDPPIWSRVAGDRFVPQGSCWPERLDQLSAITSKNITQGLRGAPSMKAWGVALCRR